MIKRLSLKNQFILTFASVIFLSLISTICSLVLLYYFLSVYNEKSVQPANYYEKKVPSIEKFVELKGEKILEVSFQKNLEKVIPMEGITYQVINLRGNKIYGTLDDQLIENNKSIYEKVNRSDQKGKVITKYLPILDKNRMEGVLAVRYVLASSIDYYIKYIFLIILLIPFLFLTLYSYVFARRFGKELNKPIKELSAASQKIKNQDLDFEIKYESENEIGVLIDSFNSMKEELKTSLYLQWKLEQERRDMVASIAHDLRTPLTIILSHVEVLMDPSLNGQKRLPQYLQTIKNNTQRVLHLTEEMKRVSEVDNPDFTLDIEGVIPIEMLPEMLEEFKKWAEDEEIKFTYSLNRKPGEGNSEFALDPKRLHQILTNLISNSIRFTPVNGSIDVQVQIEKDMMSFSISDTGKGFDTKDLPFLFSKFYQGDPSRNDQLHHGLGLYIVKELVIKHGGEIHARNNEPQGACIEFTISSINK
ncbi:MULTISPECIES: HAMP domain-containing sensor histidine kinase [Priestia]|jgi:two-component system, OmpR family, lantibiotic biosynthesis sensor histidine kinase NisK/SpaK|uniref:histidine kinase n=9 Tax=Priestia TaxID=2800373 RepID=D5E4F5_PRIM1|nr:MULTISPECIES: HAMP domain-containing sensor histidine kinase [Priestia]KQU13686.1 histidine kinase [Bacillus sp. Leaf75]MBZ5482447.1 HAMP domain-containing histidine kinase [Bacillus sp. T_4]MEB2277332.1 HAMP domain-containing histidine kinase [Bacillus sp. ILBB4]ADE72680.1 sensor histidine kinase [Priestia megaterium QM B1551]AQU76777.1 two-component sensor histidine kinase [Priestia megaterium]